ncbi:helix-turn-helix domain-containing protein [Nocardiopsis sp. LOL_012]|uniref:helix-turn-helix domain-containing protein n=1 Tax=Nocardiopsis sp. LOL_012 TaxID=3345409 RepID=UPI003A87062A
MTEEQARQFGEYIRRLRTAKGWGVRELARSSGVSPALISLLEQGYQRPKVDTLKALASTLDVPSAEVFAAAGYTDPCGASSCIGAHLRACYGHLSERTIAAIEDFVCRIEEDEHRTQAPNNTSETSRLYKH